MEFKYFNIYTFLTCIFQNINNVLNNCADKLKTIMHAVILYTKYIKLYTIIYTIQLLLENLRVVTINESQVMMRSSLNIAPGKKLCKPC